MDCPVCDKQFAGPTCYCGFTKPGGVSKVTHRNTEHAIPENGVDRDALGPDLHDALNAIGQLTTIRAWLGRADVGQMPKRIVADYRQKEAAAIGTLRATLPKLAAADVTEIVQRHPWVAAC